MQRLDGIENKEIFKFKDPDSGEAHDFVAVDKIESEIIVDVLPGATEVPLSDPTLAPGGVPTVANPTLLSTFQGRNQPFQTNKFILLKRVSLTPLVNLDDREVAALQAAQIDSRVGNNAFDPVAVNDVVASRALPEMCLVEGAGAACGAVHHFGPGNVGDISAWPRFVLRGTEDFVVNLRSLLATGFFVGVGVIVGGCGATGASGTTRC